MPALAARAAEEAAQQQRSQAEPTTAMVELQAQLQETQQSLADHFDKVRTLENMLAEHHAIKEEVSSLRDAMEERKREMELFRLTSARRSHDRHDEDNDYTSDDDDARSVSTVVPHELERVEEEDEEQCGLDEHPDGSEYALRDFGICEAVGDGRHKLALGRLEEEGSDGGPEEDEAYSNGISDDGALVMLVLVEVLLE